MRKAADPMPFGAAVAGKSAQKMTRQIARIEDALELWGQRFPFYLEHQQLDLGVAGSVDYYYMPVSPLRGDDPGREVSNFHSCLEHYWCVLERSGHGNDWDQQRDFVLASSYELVRTDKAIQRIFRDAFLRRRSFRPGQLKLSDDVRGRIQSVVANCDKEAVRQELARRFRSRTTVARSGTDSERRDGPVAQCRRRTLPQ